MKLKVTVDGKVYEIEVEVAEPDPPRPGYVPPGGHAHDGPSAGDTAPTSPTSTGAADVVTDETKVCRSPIAGVVVRVSAQPGQAIKADDVLLVLEAMKMETEITSPRDGTIAKVNAEVGSSVQSGQVLIEFD